MERAKFVWLEKARCHQELPGAGAWSILRVEARLAAAFASQCPAGTVGVVVCFNPVCIDSI